MKEETGSLRRLILAVVGAILFAIGIGVLTRAPGSGYIGGIGLALVGIAFLLAGAILLAFPVSHLLSGAFGSLFYPNEKLRRPPPLYSRAEALAKKDHFDDAMAAYEQIAEDYPDELKPYVDMIDIAILHYRDPDRAEQIYQRGLATLQNQEDLDTLSQVYTGIRSRIEAKKDWQKTRTLRLD